MKAKRQKSKALSDAELAARYDTGKVIDFDAELKKMQKAPSPTTKGKQP